jgi:class 3 adenylate cyclase
MTNLNSQLENDPEVRYCTTSDGVQIAYAVDERGAGIPALLLAAPFTNVRPSYWGEFTEMAFPTPIVTSRGRRPTAWLDFRGCGLSDRTVDDVSMDAIERDLKAVIQKLNWSRFSLEATGMPGPLAMKYAAEHPDRVASLVLRETYARAADMGRIPRMRALGATLREDWESYCAMMIWTAYGWSESGERLMKLLSGCSTPETVRAYARATRSFDATGFVEQISARTLVLGRDDMPVPSGDMLRQLGARIRDARVVMVGGGLDAGRNGMEIIEAFLAEGDPILDDSSGATIPSAFRTVLFTDLVGHTEMMSRLGDERGREVLREHERITREVLKAHGGTEVKTMGDGFMASFGSVTKAVECAVALQRAFDGHEGEALNVRVGLNAGEPIEDDGDLFGATVILASRIAAKAGGGEILVADTVRGLCSGKGFLFADRGEFVAKGFEEPVRVYEVSWQG